MKRMTFFLSALVLSMPYFANAYTGEELWARNCKSCHGQDGSGHTAMGKRLSIKDFTTAEAQDSITDEGIKETIINGKILDSGRRTMVAFGQMLSDEEIDLLVTHFRSLKAN